MVNYWIYPGYVKIGIENCPFSSLIHLLKMVIFQFTMLVYQTVPSNTTRSKMAIFAATIFLKSLDRKTESNYAILRLG
jgi:hypothetical protein